MPAATKLREHRSDLLERARGQRRQVARATPGRPTTASRSSSPRGAASNRRKLRRDALGQPFGQTPQVRIREIAALVQQRPQQADREQRVALRALHEPVHERAWRRALDHRLGQLAHAGAPERGDLQRAKRARPGRARTAPGRRRRAPPARRVGSSRAPAAERRHGGARSSAAPATTTRPRGARRRARRRAAGGARRCRAGRRVPAAGAEAKDRARAPSRARARRDETGSRDRRGARRTAPRPRSSGSERRNGSTASVHSPNAALAASGYAWAASPVTSRWRASSSRASRLLPTPASPSSRTSRNSPATARPSSSSSAASSSRRPTSSGLKRRDLRAANTMGPTESRPPARANQAPVLAGARYEHRA